MTALLLLALAAAPLTPCWGDGHNDERSSAAKREFMRHHPCPGGPDIGSTRRCRGYVIDHVCPLACCGDDAPSNMQYQTEADGKAKDKWELDCRLSCIVGPSGAAG